MITRCGDNGMANPVIERSFISFHNLYWNKSAPQWRGSAISLFVAEASLKISIGSPDL